MPPASVPSSHVAYRSTAILAGSRGALEAALLGVRQDADAGRDELVEERRQLRGGLDLDPLPAPDLRHGRPGLGFLEIGRDRLEPAGDGVEPLGERGVIAGEQQEQPVADGVERERAPLPEPEHVGVEDRAADVVELEVALERRRRRQAGRVDRLDRREVRPLRVQLGQDGFAAAVAEQVVVLRAGRARWRAPGCRGRAARSASRRGRRTRSSSGPGVGRRGRSRQSRRRAWIDRLTRDLRRAGRAARGLAGGGWRGRPDERAGSGRCAASAPMPPPSGSSRSSAARVASMVVSISSDVTP